MSDYKQAIFSYISEEHGVLLLESERDELIRLINSELSKEIGDLQQENGNLRCALRGIIQHQEIMAGALSKMSATRSIAERALNE